MKYMTHSIASTTWLALKRSRIYILPGRPLMVRSCVLFARRIRVHFCSTRYHPEMGRCIGVGALLQKRHRRRYAAGAVRHTGERQSHLDTAQRAQQSELVALAEMADAKHLAGKLRQSGAERHVVIFKHGFAELVGVVPRRHQYGGQDRRKFGRLLTQKLEAPLPDRGAGGRREALVAGGTHFHPPPPPPRGRL